jgi:hypothetical protein
MPIIKCPDCGEPCQLGGMTKHGWNLVSMKREGVFVVIGSHFSHCEVGGHCGMHEIGINQFSEGG